MLAQNWSCSTRSQACQVTGILCTHALPPADELYRKILKHSDTQKSCGNHPQIRKWWLCHSVMSPKALDGMVNGPGHAKKYFMPYANNKGADQPAHPCSLISTFVVHCLDNFDMYTCYIQSFKILASFCS